MNLTFERLSRAHNRASFSSGEPALDEWFRLRASQDEKRNVARVTVAIDRDHDSAIVGFYSLSAFSVKLASLPEDLRRKLPGYPRIPACLVGRLARAESVRGQGLGELLLVDAIARILVASDSMGISLIVVDAKNSRAERFYRAFGFTPFDDAPNRLYLPVSTARVAVTQSHR